MSNDFNDLAEDVLRDPVARQAAERNKAYREWSEDWVGPCSMACVGTCKDAVAAMVGAFPELRAAMGYVRYESLGMPKGKQVPHWWCIAPDGNIVDPTAPQSNLVRILGYKEVDPNAPRLQKCMCCGEYGADFACSPECADELAEIYNPPKKTEEHADYTWEDDLGTDGQTGEEWEDQ